MATLTPSTFTLPDGRAITLRSLSPADVDAFHDFRRQVPKDSTHTMLYEGMREPTVEETTKWLSSQGEHPSALALGAFDGARVVGFLTFRPLDTTHPWIQHIAQFGMMIRKEYWGGGLGKRMLEVQDEHARRHGITRIEAMVRAANERGLSLYTRAGYRVEGTRKEAARIDAGMRDEFFIAKLLNNPTLDWRPPTLETARLVLRPIELVDAPAIFAYAKNPNVCRHTLWEAHASVKDSEAFIKDYVFRHYREGTPEPLGIALREDPGTLIGTVGCFWTSRPSRAMELAYAIGEEHWGQGLVAEAARATMDYCFDELKPVRIQARCKVENRASARVMEKVGMQREGTLRSALFHRGKFWDMDFYAEVRS